MIKNYADRSPDEQRYWIKGWDDCAKGKESQHEALAGAGSHLADYYLAGWKAVDECADEILQSLRRKQREQPLVLRYGTIAANSASLT